MQNLYPHNRQAYDAVMQAYSDGKRRVCIVHATGTGKSYVIGALSEQFKSVLVIAPMIFVLDETRKVCGDNVDFCTYGSLLYKMPERKYDLIVLDEFHRAGAEQWGGMIQKLLDRNSQAKVFGATATSMLDDGNQRTHHNLYPTYDMIENALITEQEENGNLRKEIERLTAILKERDAEIVRLTQPDSVMQSSPLSTEEFKKLLQAALKGDKCCGNGITDIKCGTKEREDSV